ncbi:hypothetical protein GE09DRAFT_1230066 [Coniochaeta sp. 2T2.1]|nr:hypothetical protein GE09DRAFT_1230066 [Coniochaeta sp. 2T2.1]
MSSTTSSLLSGLIPEGKRLQTRIGLAMQARNKRRHDLENPFWQFTAVQFSALVVMPLRPSVGIALMDLHPLVERWKGSQPLVSGRAFEVRLETKRDAEQMKSMTELQWACAVIAAMSGAGRLEDMNQDVHQDKCARRRVIAWLNAVKAAGPEVPREDNMAES